VQRLIETERKLEDRIEKFRLQKEVMKTSYTAAAAEVMVTQAMTGVGTSFENVGDTLRRAEDKVSGMRAKADAMQSLTESGVLVDQLDNRPKAERELDALRVGSAIEGDLERLKTELAAGKDGTPAA
jgi:phage shock protein A